MSFDITGRLHVKENTQDVSASFKKREFVLEVENEKNQEWNDFIKFQLTQDRCSSIDSIAVGQKMKVTFNIKGRKWEKDGKVSYFSNLEAWRVEAVDGQSANNEPLPSYQVTEIPPAGEEGDDLPF
jgi:hypothetical protein